MELTRKGLEAIRFRTKGRWYNAEQVDVFIEEVILGLEAKQRDIDDLFKEGERLRGELGDAKAEIAKLKEQQEKRAAGDLKHGDISDLEEQRDKLIGDIKDLKRFRENFKAAVEKDAQSLLGQVKELPSEKLL